MHGIAEGYSYPVPFGLERCAEPSSGWRSYDSTRDSVASFLERAGLTVRGEICGSLPLGYGFAGSTVLALLHLNVVDLAEAKRHMSIIMSADSSVHGFEPSGLDFWAVTGRSPIFFGRGQHRVAPAMPFSVRYVTFPKERLLTLAEVRLRVEANAGLLAEIATAITAGIERESESVYELLLAYSSSLATVGIYSRSQRAFALDSIARGVVTKGIGGLYDKAMLVTGEERRVASSVSFAIELGGCEVV